MKMKDSEGHAIKNWQKYWNLDVWILSVFVHGSTTEAISFLFLFIPIIVTIMSDDGKENVLY